MGTHWVHPELLERQVRVLVVGCGGTGSAVVAGLPYLHERGRRVSGKPELFATPLFVLIALLIRTLALTVDAPQLSIYVDTSTAATACCPKWTTHGAASTAIAGIATCQADKVLNLAAGQTRPASGPSRKEAREGA
jgi:hypothetical protein